MPSAARRWSNQSSCDEFGEAIVWCVERRELGDWATSVCDDHFLTGHNATDVLAQSIPEVADPDLNSTGLSKNPVTHAFYRAFGFSPDAKHAYLARP